MFHPWFGQLDVQALGIVYVCAGKEIVLVVETEVRIAGYVLKGQGVIYGLCPGCEWKEGD